MTEQQLNRERKIRLAIRKVQLERRKSREQFYKMLKAKWEDKL